MKSAFVGALRLAVGLGALWFLLSRIEGDAAWSTFLAADARWLGAALLAQVGSKMCWVLRWDRLLAAARQRRSPLELLRLILLGLFFNNFLPTSVGGDVVRGVELARGGVPKALAATTVVADRLVGLVALALLAVLGGAAGYWLMPGQGPWVASVAFALFVATAITVVTRPQLLDRLGRISGSGPIVTKGKKVVESMSFVSGQRSAVLTALTFSLGLAACSALYHWSVARAVGIDVPVMSWFVIVPAVMLFAALPISLNGLGVRELGFVGFLGTQGVPDERATVFALLAFVGTLGFAVAGGVLFLAGDRSKVGGEA